MTHAFGSFTASTWGWLDEDGNATSRGAATFCLWSFRNDTHRLGFVALRVDAPVEAVAAAGRGLVDAQYASGQHAEHVVDFLAPTPLG